MNSNQIYEKIYKEENIQKSSEKEEEAEKEPVKVILSYMYLINL